jgi:hypothetical protein
MNTFKRLIASLVIVSTALLGFPLAAQASVVTTEEALSVEASAADRERVTGFLSRADVRTALEQQGISADAAAERVRAMSDVEVAQLADRVDQAPAGGNVLGILFTIFVILLVTDILGFTKIFPFTRSIR